MSCEILSYIATGHKYYVFLEDICLCEPCHLHIQNVIQISTSLWGAKQLLYSAEVFRQQWFHVLISLTMIWTVGTSLWTFTISIFVTLTEAKILFWLCKYCSFVVALSTSGSVFLQALNFQMWKFVKNKNYFCL